MCSAILEKWSGDEFKVIYEIFILFVPHLHKKGGKIFKNVVNSEMLFPYLAGDTSATLYLLCLCYGCAALGWKISFQEVAGHMLHTMGNWMEGVKWSYFRSHNK